MIGIIDYGLGNLTSVAGAVDKLGFPAIITADPARLAEAEKLILPGVGAFGDGMRNLRERDLVAPLTDLVMRRRKPLLGICLGFQLMARSSEEFGAHEGLGWIDARIERLLPGEDSLRVPHVGWNELHRTGDDCILFDGVPEDALFYYVHSFRMAPANDNVIAGECDYGGRFTSAIQQGSLFGTQFHPEKSQRHGLTVLKNFLEKA